MVPRLGFEPRSHGLRVRYNDRYTNEIYDCGFLLRPPQLHGLSLFYT